MFFPPTLCRVEMLQWVVVVLMTAMLGSSEERGYDSIKVLS